MDNAFAAVFLVALVAMGAGITGLFSKSKNRVRTFRRVLVVCYLVVWAIVLLAGFLMA